jgi:hypothetical protein
MIKNLTPTLMERGKIKIGKLGPERPTKYNKKFQPPVKLEHFSITTMERGEDGNLIEDRDLMKIYGHAPKEIPVMLLYDDLDLNFATRYACYAGKQCVCSGDGETATRLDRNTGKESSVPCPCELLDPQYTGKTKCKPNGCLSVVIQGAQSVGGVWKYRTTGWNSVNAILSSLMLIRTITAGVLSNIPLVLRMAPRTSPDPRTGATRKYNVVWIEYPGSPAQLKSAGLKIAMERETHKLRMDDIETQARKMLEHTPNDIMPADEVPEFYPDTEDDGHQDSPIAEIPPVPAITRLHGYLVGTNMYSPEQRDDIVAFVDAVADAQGVDSDEVIEDILASEDNFDRFMATYYEETGQDQTIDQPVTPEGKGVFDTNYKEVFRASWINLTGKGFKPFVINHCEDWQAYPEQEKEAREKFARLYEGEAWPFDLPETSDDETTETPDEEPDTEKDFHSMSADVAKARKEIFELNRMDPETFEDVVAALHRSKEISSRSISIMSVKDCAAVKKKMNEVIDQQNG